LSGKGISAPFLSIFPPVLLVVLFNLTWTTRHELVVPEGIVVKTPGYALKNVKASAIPASR
jgi:hypothetical protein